MVACLWKFAGFFEFFWSRDLSFFNFKLKPLCYLFYMKVGIICIEICYLIKISGQTWTKIQQIKIFNFDMNTERFSLGFPSLIMKRTKENFLWALDGRNWNHSEEEEVCSEKVRKQNFFFWKLWKICKFIDNLN